MVPKFHRKSYKPRELDPIRPLLASSPLELLDHLARLALAHLFRDRVLGIVLPSEDVDESLLLVRRWVSAWI